MFYDRIEEYIKIYKILYRLKDISEKFEVEYKHVSELLSNLGRAHINIMSNVLSRSFAIFHAYIYCDYDDYTNKSTPYADLFSEVDVYICRLFTRL
jgi:hypothetical protein